MSPRARPRLHRPKALRPPIESDTPLTIREAHFVAEYVACNNNGAQAAIRAGYAPKSARVTGSQLLARPNVQAALQAAEKAALARADLSASRILRDIDSAANLDAAELFDIKGRLRPIRDLPVHVRRAITAVEVVRRRRGDTVIKLKFVDKGKMHEILARHAGIGATDPPLEQAVSAFALPPETPRVSVH